MAILADTLSLTSLYHSHTHAIINNKLKNETNLINKITIASQIINT